MMYGRSTLPVSTPSSSYSGSNSCTPVPPPRVRCRAPVRYCITTWSSSSSTIGMLKSALLSLSFSILADLSVEEDFPPFGYVMFRYHVPLERSATSSGVMSSPSRVTEPLGRSIIQHLSSKSHRTVKGAGGSAVATFDIASPPLSPRPPPVSISSTICVMIARHCACTRVSAAAIAAAS